VFKNFLLGVINSTNSCYQKRKLWENLARIFFFGGIKKLLKKEKKKKP